MHATSANQRIQINNYRQFKFGIHLLTHPPTDRRPRAKLTTAIKSRIHPRRDGGASGNARAPTFAAERPAAAQPFKLQVAPSGAAVSRPFTRPCTALHCAALRCTALHCTGTERAFKNLARLPSGEFPTVAAYRAKSLANVRCITRQGRTCRAVRGDDHGFGARSVGPGGRRRWSDVRGPSKQPKLLRVACNWA